MIQNGHLNLRCGSSSVITLTTVQNETKHKQKSIAIYTILINVPGVLLPDTKAEKNKHDNFNFYPSFFIVFSFFLNHA